MNGINWNSVPGGSGAGVNIYISQQPGQIQHIRLTVQSGGQTYFAYHSFQVVVQGYNGLACPKSAKADPSNISNNGEVFISPNPTNQQIVIRGGAEGEHYIIYNSVGQVVLDGRLSHELKVTLDHMRAGTYYIKIHNTIEKIIKY